MKLKIGDRVRVVSEKLVTTTTNKIINGMTGTVKDNSGPHSIGVEFDDYVGGGKGRWGGKGGHCFYVEKVCLEEIEETEEEVNEETKADTLEQKILTVLREEIGVLIGDEFDVYENERKKWTCKFEENGHLTRCHENGKFSMTFIWKYWIFRFDKYVFKKKPFMPQNGEEYFCLYIKPTSSGVKYLDAGVAVWNGISFDYGMLALGNVFRTKEEALKSEDKLLERLNELLKGEE